MTHPNSIWIELNSKAPNGVEPRAWRELQCALANNMLKRLGISNREFFLGSDCAIASVAITDMLTCRTTVTGSIWTISEERR